MTSIREMRQGYLETYANFTWRDILLSPQSFVVTEEETLIEFPSDGLLPERSQKLYRGITIDASPQIVFSWLCQMRRAPYSYDWIDNLGRKSPRERDDTLCLLSKGDRFMFIFPLADFEKDRYVTLTTNIGRFFIYGNYIDYLIMPIPSNKSVRLLVKLNVDYKRGLFSCFLRHFLAFGDAIMMAKQLRTFKRYAEEDDTQQEINL